MDNTTKDARRVYGAVISFDTPYESQVTIGARDIEHAKELLVDLFKERENFRIIDVFDMSDLTQASRTDIEAEDADFVAVPKDQLN